MHDVATLERLRVPTVAIVTDPFASSALYQAKELGLRDAERVLLLAAHPISNVSVAVIQGKAVALYSQLVRALTTDDVPDVALRRRLRSAKGPTGMCAVGG